MKTNTTTPLRVILTGATGMVGEGVLLECLQHPDVESVVVIGRRSCNLTHPKLTEIIHADFFDISPIAAQLAPYNTCFFCLGGTSIGLSEEEYTRNTYTLTMQFATELSKLNSEMNFLYISGSGTDSTESGRTMWARVKGKTENNLMKLPFKQVFAVRPGYLQPSPNAQRTLSFYKYISWMYPLFKLIGSRWAGSLQELGKGMIHAITKGYHTNVLEVKDIRALSEL